MTTDTRRLTILSAEEISALYDLPKFNDDDRRLYFDFSSVERDAVDRVHTSSAAVHLALQMAYFKAKRRFFVFELLNQIRSLTTSPTSSSVISPARRSAH